MKFNKESFEKAIKANKIVRYQKHFESVVKSYLEAETERCNISDVVGQSEQFYCELPNKTECRSTGVQCLECKNFEKTWKRLNK